MDGLRDETDQPPDDVTELTVSVSGVWSFWKNWRNKRDIENIKKYERIVKNGNCIDGDPNIGGNHSADHGDDEGC